MERCSRRLLKDFVNDFVFPTNFRPGKQGLANLSSNSITGSDCASL